MQTSAPPVLLSWTCPNLSRLCLPAQARTLYRFKGLLALGIYSSFSICCFIYRSAFLCSMCYIKDTVGLTYWTVCMLIYSDKILEESNQSPAWKYFNKLWHRDAFHSGEDVAWIAFVSHMGVPGFEFWFTFHSSFLLMDVLGGISSSIFTEETQVPSTWLWPGPVWDVVDIWEVNHECKIFLWFSALQIKIFLNLLKCVANCFLIFF